MEKITIFEKFTKVLGYRTIPQIVEAIKQGVYKDKILSIRRTVARGDKKLVDQLKKQLQAFTISGNFEGGRTIKHLVEYHPYVILDIDKVETEELKRITEEVVKIDYTHVGFLSPSGNGLKIIVKVNSKFSEHQEAFKQVVNFYEEKLRIKVDQSGKDVMRLCFFSFDPEVFYNKKSKVFVVEPLSAKPLFEKEKPKSSTVKENSGSKILSQDVLKKLDQALEFTKRKLVYTSGNRNNFVYLFASNCNREGILETEALSFAKREFDLAENEVQKTIQSAYRHHGNEHGGNQIKKQNKRYQQLDAQESFYSNLTQTPCFPNHVYEHLPNLLKHCCKVFDSNREKDVFLTGALAVLSGSLSNVQGIYDGRTEYSNIFTFIIAPPANGKGALKYSAMLGDAFHRKLSEERQEALTNYRLQMTEYRSAVRDFTKGKRNEFPEEPEVPELKLFFIPANSSSAMVIKHLQESGGVGVIFETEADTLGNVLKQDWGGFSDLLRKAFHFEPISYSRKSNDEFIEIRAPRLSVALSGTPGQVFQLIPSAEDGLYSRFCLYAFNTGVSWRNVAKPSKVNLDTFFEEQSEKILKMIEFWKAHPAQFTLSENQWNDLNLHFEKLLHQASVFERWEALSIVKRMALILFRIAMLLTAIRRYESDDWSGELVCEDNDYQIANSLVEVFRQHSFFLFDILGKAKGINYQQLPNRKKQFFEKLPKRFTRKEAIELGKELGISRTSTDRWLKQMTKDYLEQIEYGIYQKIKSGKVGKLG